MNEFVPPPIPPSNLPLADKRNWEPPVRLSRLLLGLALAVAFFDICFWKIGTVGFSFGLFFLVLTGIVLMCREPLRMKRSTWLILALLLGATWAAMIETCITNTFVLLALILALAGDTYFSDVDSPWGRWLSQLVALTRAPGRVFWLGARIAESVFNGGLGWTSGIVGGCLLAIPALVLTLIFGSLLASGNAVFGSWTNSFFDWFWKELALCLDPERIFFWLVAAFLIFPLLRPVQVGEWWWKWTERLPRLPEILPIQAAVFSSLMILVVLNLLFLVANIADALFLWSGQAMPVGVDYKSYVHEGVNTLIATVILTAIVLTAIFQQALGVAQSKGLKALAYLWIAQNLFLLLSVALRIKYYIVEYELTVARLGVIIFLILVASGFVLLTIKILKDKSLSWLVGGCVVAVFVSFYITQFLDLEGWSANYNIATWEKDRTRTLDFYHLYGYGPSGWPAMRRAHEVDPSIAVLNPASSNGFPTTTETVHLAQFDSLHWREFSLRAYWNRWALDDKK
jgi:hypothetical protein